MAVATSVTIGTASKITADYQSQEVHISCTYALESADTDLLAFSTEKAEEIEKVHTSVWRRIRELRSSHNLDPDKTAAATAPKKETTRSRRAATPVEPSSDVDMSAHTASEVNEAVTPTQPSEAAPALRLEVGAGEETVTIFQQRAIRSLAARSRIADADFAQQLSKRFGKTDLMKLTKDEAATLLVEMQKYRQTALPAAV